MYVRAFMKRTAAVLTQFGRLHYNRVGAEHVSYGVGRSGQFSQLVALRRRPNHNYPSPGRHHTCPRSLAPVRTIPYNTQPNIRRRGRWSPQRCAPQCRLIRRHCRPSVVDSNLFVTEMRKQKCELISFLELLYSGSYTRKYTRKMNGKLQTVRKNTGQH